MKPKSTHHFGAKSSTKTMAKILRRNQTPAEERMWQILRNRNHDRLKFRRQHPLANYIADFYCHELLLVLELDGDIHDLKKVKDRDRKREEAIKKLGVTVFRFRNEEVFMNPDRIAEKISAFRALTLDPSPKGRG